MQPDKEPQLVVRAVDARDRRTSKRSVVPEQAPIKFRDVTRMPIGRDWLLKLIEISINSVMLITSLLMVTLIVHGEIWTRHVLLAIVTFLFTFPGFSHLNRTIPSVARHLIVNWLAVSGILVALGIVTGTLTFFDSRLLVTWWCVAPLSQFAAHLLLRFSRPAILRLQGAPKRTVVAGVNEQGVELARRLEASRYSRSLMVGFFDDRADDRIQGHGYPILGSLQDLPRFANDNNIDTIYISLPMHSQPRILALLDALRDTTSSIYFVPDIFVTDLIQGRADAVEGLPVVAVCESPFIGLSGLIKRTSDVVFSLIILFLLLPILLIISLGVKLSSAGPLIFKQRRYGLDGKEIVIYKFRTMTVNEDGDNIRQASKHDARVTGFGAFLRKASLDELPQFVNVLQGRMSIVGPRPHAVAHNELYRRLIKGYMQRHKVRPGITGWAQVNGLRGETETVEQMKKRIDCDLYYLRHWSLTFDSYIIAKTVWVVFKDQRNAY